MNEIMTFWMVIGIAATTAVVHTLTGPDHYLPFIALAGARRWSIRRTLFLTFVSGIGHILSVLLLAAVFTLLSERLSDLHRDMFESVRGSLAAWMLAVLGAAYFLWGIRHAVRHHRHTHEHQHADGTVHTHEHTDLSIHAHPHDSGKSPLLAWSLFIIFVLGPCEAMLPILVSAAAVSRSCLFLAAVVFSVTTLVTMLATVATGYYGSRVIVIPGAERWSHLMAGAVLAFCGFGMIFLGL